MGIGVRGVLGGASLALAAGTAGAAVFVVDTDLDTTGGGCLADRATLPTSEGTCSLRSAIAAANGTSGSDLILFAPAVFNTAANRVITLQSPLPDFAETVEVNAVSPPLLTQRVQGIVLRAGTGVTELFAVAAGQPQLADLALEGAGLSIEAGRLEILQTVDATIAGAIGGAGSLQKEGSARLILTGTNSYANTTIAEGTLQGDTLSIPGAGRTVTNDGILVFDQASTDPPEFLGLINGSGSLQKIGAGTLILLSPNSYSGGTTVSAGTLQGFAGSGTAGSLQGNIANEATLVFDQAAAGTFAGAITGSGRVEKTGAGELELTGSNRYTGGTSIEEGSLRGDADAIPGGVAIGTGTQLIFDEPGSGTNSGNLTGGGGLAFGSSVEKRGAGTLTLTGVNTYSGGTLVSGGTLRGTTRSLQGDIALDPDPDTASVTLAFDQAFAGDFTGSLTGELDRSFLEKSGSGTLTLVNELPDFGGLTTVAGGRLDLGRLGVGDGAFAGLPGDVQILSGGVLGGIGRLGGLASVRSGGAISPGSSIGTLTVGSASFESGSFLEIEIAPPVGSPLLSPVDLLGATGTVTIAPGARVRVIPGPGDYPDQEPDAAVPIVTASAIDGVFDPIPLGTFAFLDATLSYTSTQVLLTVESNGNELEDFATSGNQRAVATALAAARETGDPDVETVFGELERMFAADIPDALDAMAGEQLTQFATARLAVGERFHASIQDRIRGGAEGGSGALLSESGAGPPLLAASPLLLGGLAGVGLGSAARAAVAGATLAVQQPAGGYVPEPALRGLGAWMDGYGLFGDVSGGSGTDDFDSTIWGLSGGLDARLAERWIVGAAGGWAQSDLDFDDLAGSPEVQTAQAAAYAGYVSPLLEAGAAFRFGWNRMSLDRDIDFAPPSTLSRTADSEFDGIDLGGHAEAALNLFDVGGVAIQPLASLRYAHLDQDSFDESGAGSLDLSAEQEEIDSLVSGLGARLHALFDLGDGFWIRPELSGRWLHEFGDRERRLEARIGGVPGVSYGVRGAELARDTGLVGLAWTVSTRGLLHVFAEYDLGINPDRLQHSAAIGVAVRW